MAKRILQISLDGNIHDNEQLDDIVEGHAVLLDQPGDGETPSVLQVLVGDEETEALMDRCEELFGSSDSFRLVLLPVEAVLPRPKEDKEVADDGESEQARARRVSREELYSDIVDSLGRWQVFVALACLSTIVASVGLIEDDVAVIVGAMVIAPLLSPNVAQALAVALGDVELGRRALQRNGLGLSIAFALAFGIGLLHDFDPFVDAISSRTDASLGSVILALAAGAAGTLAYTIGLSGAVIGVMVAVALLPPLVVCGLLLGAGEWRGATGAGVLTLINIICINLAGVATFYLQGVRPRTWFENSRARRAMWISVPIWLGLLAVLIGILFFSDFGLSAPQ